MSTLDEHRVLVEAAGAWGTDNLGQFEVTGLDAGALVNRIATVDISRLPPGRFAHALLLRDDASILERVTVYRFPDRVMLLVGAVNRVAAWEHIVARKRGTVRLRDISTDVGQVAVRGPATMSRLAIALAPMPSSAGDVVNARLGDVDVFAARATADGPDGVDLFCRERDRHKLLELMRSLGVLPVSDAAWSLLHMEWGVAHVGAGIDPGDTPIEADLEHLVAEGKGAPFPGEAALASRRHTGALKRLVGFRAAGSRRPPVDAVVRVGGHEADRVRAVTWSPRAGVIGFTAVPTTVAAPGTMLSIEADGEMWQAEVAERPFVSREQPWGSEP